MDDKQALQEPTIDWLIDQIAPNKGNSPLVNFNKDRLRKLIDAYTEQRAIQSRAWQTARIESILASMGIGAVAENWLRKERESLEAQLKASTNQEDK